MSAASAPSGARAAVAALGAALALGCATGGSQQIQSDLDGVQQQLWKVQKENAALTEQINALRTEASRPPAEGTPAAIGAADLKLRLDGLDRDLAVLRSRADDSDQRLEALTRDLRLTRETIETLARASTGAPAPAGPAPIPAPPSAAAPAPPFTSASGDRAQGSVPGSPAVGEIFRRASADHARGDDDAALRGFQDVLRLAPKGDLADDAQYLIGAIDYGQQRYQEAVTAFDALLQEFPGSDKAAAGHLNKGLALLALNRTADAVIQFQHVVSRYPKSEEARIARERLRALGLKDR